MTEFIVEKSISISNLKKEILQLEASKLMKLSDKHIRLRATDLLSLG
jgi:hypothetical protein